MPRILLVILPVMLLVAASGFRDAIADDNIYRWTDAQGVVHFGNMPPQGQPVEEVRVDPPVSPPAVQPVVTDTPATAAVTDGEVNASAADEPEVSYAQQRRDEREAKRRLRKSEALEREINCARMEQQRAALEPATRVIVTDDDGNSRRLDDDERVKGVEEAKAFLRENCES
jgi:hypothetical protein